jgi:hypothetical protein
MFGDDIFHAIEIECVSMKVSKIGFEDAIICLNIGFESKLISTLFPLAYEALKDWMATPGQEVTVVPSKTGKQTISKNSLIC